MNLHSGKETTFLLSILIGGSYNYFAVSKKRPDLKEELDQAMQKIVKENPFYIDDLYKRYLLRKFP